jgi:diguanylate cyclase (GGDEF)-like protein
MDGVELCRRLRKLPKGSETVVVFVTGADRKEDLDRALEAGADDYLLKPINDANLPVRLALAERKVHFLRDRKRTEERLLRDAFRDPVTDLANGALFTERLHRTARRAGRESSRLVPGGSYLFAVLCVNVDAFGKVVTSLGYERGNEVLRQVGQRLEECVRAVDTVARFQGDEFMVLLDDMKDVSDPGRVTRRIEQALRAPFQLDADEVRVTASLGIAINLTGPEDPDELLEDARKALRRAKEEGPGSVQMFDAVIHARAQARLQLERDLQHAVENGEMTLHYQPIVSVEDTSVLGYEALVRWNQPDRGAIPPEQFIPLAEATGLIVPLGWWVLEKATQQVAEWRARLPEDRSLFVSVNVAARQFGQPDAVARITGAIERFEVDPDALHVELTETAVMTDLNVASRIMHQLREASVPLYVDDFGTGYSSLSYLCRLPIDSLKIDRSFVTQITRSPENLEVVRTIARLAGNLKMGVIAEGVETEAQLDALRGLGCQRGQGYLFGRPRPASEVEASLQGLAAP